MIDLPDSFEAGSRLRKRPWFEWVAGMIGLRGRDRVLEDGEAPYYMHGDGANEDVPDLRDRATCALLADLAAGAKVEPDRFLSTTFGYRARVGGSMPARPVSPPAAARRPGADPVPGREGTDPVPSLLARLAAIGDGQTPVGIYWHPDATSGGACDLEGPGWGVEVADAVDHGPTLEAAIAAAEERARRRA